MKHKNWDYLFVFDAMRYQEGGKVLSNYFQGQMDKINTGCSTTFQWYKKYWSQKEPETILISENPMPWHKNSGLVANNFHTAKMSFGTNWLKVEPPKTLELFFQQIEETPDQKVIVHFLPPHLPFFSGEGADLMIELEYNQRNIYQAVQEWGQKNGFNKLKKYYRQQIEELASMISRELHRLPENKTLVITSDHGELIGFEGHQYDHPENPSEKQKKLLHWVPWLQVDITATLVNQRMVYLGYMSS